MKTNFWIYPLRLFGLAMISAVLTSEAFAHAKVKPPVPAMGAAVEAPIESVTLNFAKKVRLVDFDLFTLQDGEEASDKKINLDDNPVAEPKAPLMKSFSKGHSIAFEALPLGRYLYKWKALARDGHTMRGQGHFSVIAP